MPREHWTPGEIRNVPPVAGEKYDCDLCPGRAVTLDSVSEGARAYAWFLKGQLEVAFPSPSAKVIEACEVSLQAWNLYEAEQRELAARQSGG